MKNVTIKIEAEALLKLVELGYGFEVIGNTTIPQISPTTTTTPNVVKEPETFDARQRIQPYFSELPVINVPIYNVVNLGNIVVNYLLEIKQNQQHKTNADAFHSNKTSGIYHNVLNYQYFKNTLVANWQILGGENDSLELHHSCLLGDYLSVSRDDLFYHYLNKLTGKFTKLAITEASGVIKPAAKTLLDSAIEWGSDNPSAVLSYSIFDVTKVIQSQYATNYASKGTQTQPTNKEVTMLEPTSSEPIYKEAVYLSPTSVETERAESAPNNVVNAIVRPADPERFVDKITVPDDVVEVKVATGEPITVDDKTLDTIAKIISVVEGYVDSRKEKKRNSKLYTSQLSALAGGFDLAMVKLNRATDLSPIREFEHKLNILKDELNCLTIGITANTENPLYYVNSLLKYYK